MKYVGLFELQKKEIISGKEYAFGKIHNDRRRIFEDGTKIKTAPILEDTKDYLITENIAGHIIKYLKVKN